MSNIEDEPILSEEQIKVFQQIAGEFDTFYHEIGIISKKKPGEVLNKFKLGFLNQTLVKANDVLGDEFRPFPDFTIFDIDGSLPTASDAVMMIAHYRNAMSRYRLKYSSRTSAYSSSVAWNRPNTEQTEDDELPFGEAEE